MVDDQMTACFYTSPGEQEIKRLHTGTTGTRNAPAGAILVDMIKPAFIYYANNTWLIQENNFR